MAGYLGTKAVLLSTTAATVTGDMTVGGNATISGAATFSGPFTSKGIDDNAAATAMTLDASGNVGIGTAAPTVPLTVSGASVMGSSTTQLVGSTLTAWSDTGAVAAFRSTEAGVARALYIDIDNATGVIDYNATGSAAGLHAFSTGSTERMRIDASGVAWIGGSTMPAGVAGIKLNIVGGSNDLMASYSTSTAAKTHWLFNNPNGLVGTIRTSASTTTYNTSSDYRLKENITPIQGAGDIVKSMRPVTYTFKAGGDWADGFIAHELQELHPVAVSGEKDAMRDEEYEVTPAVLDDDGNVVTEAVMGTRSVPDYQGVDYSKLTPILTAALQEALNKIDALEARLAALEAV